MQLKEKTVDPWGIYSPKDTVEKFSKEVQNIKDLNLDLWKTIITIQATILGISIALWSHNSANPNIWLKITWVLELLSMFNGFLIFSTHIELERRSSIRSSRYALCMQEISNMEARGEFRGNEEKKAGMLIICMSDLMPEAKEYLSSEYFVELTNKYVNEFKTRKIFKAFPKNLCQDFLLSNYSKVIYLFYFISGISFLALLLNLLIG